MKTLAMLATLLLLVGCETMPTANTKVWYQPGKTEAQLRTDWAESQLVAQRALVDIKQPIVFTSDSSAASFAAGAAVASERDSRNAAKRLAPLTMQSRGYQLVPLSSVPRGEAYLRP